MGYSTLIIYAHSGYIIFIITINSTFLGMKRNWLGALD